MDRPSMRRFVDCENGDVILREAERVLIALPSVEVAFNNTDGPVGLFNLKLTSERLVILNEDAGYEFDIPFIILHAISKDPNSYPKPCLYCQLDQEEDETPDELFLAPPDSEILKVLFDCMSQAAQLNPDPPEPGYEEGEDELIYNIDEVELGAQQAQALNHLESVFIEPTFDTTYNNISTTNQITPEDSVEDEEGPAKKKK